MLVSLLIATTVSCERPETEPSGLVVTEQPLMTGALKTYQDIEEMFSEPIIQHLAAGKRKLAQWADELEKTTPTTPKELWTKYEVCVRAGRYETAIKLLPVLFDLSESIPPHPHGGKHDLSRYVYDAIRESRETRQQRLELYLAFYEVFAPVYCYTLPIDEEEAGWSSEKIANWLRKHYETALQYRPIRTSWSWSDGLSLMYRNSPYVSDAAMRWQEEYMKYIQRYDWNTNPFATDADWNRLATDAKLNPYLNPRKIEIEELRLLWQKLYPITDRELSRMIVELENDYAANHDTSTKLRVLSHAISLFRKEEQKKRAIAEWSRFASDAEKNPDDMVKLSLLLCALQKCSDADWMPNLPKLDWFTETIDKRSGFESWYIASNLASAAQRNMETIRKDYLELSVPFWRRALELSLTDEQCEQIHELNSRMNAIPLQYREPESNERTRAKFRAKIYDTLNKTLLVLGRAEESQAIMEEGRQFRKEHELENAADLVLAGATQAASGQRVVEADILSREPTEAEIAANEFDKQVKYWMERANYYRGRQEWEQHEDALRRGLALFTTAELRSKNASSFHSYYQTLLKFYRETKRKDDVIKLFHEIDTMIGKEKQSPQEFYGPFIRTLKDFGEEKVIYEKWRQDVENCVAQTKACLAEAGELTDYEFSNATLELNWLMSATEVNNRPAFKFDNTDPFWWEVLPLMRGFRQKLLEVLVYHVDRFYDSSRQTTFDEKAYEKAKTILLNEKVDAKSLEASGLEDLAWILLQHNQAKYALPLYETALKRTETKHRQSLIRSKLFQTLMELGDWQRAEKVFDDLLDNGYSDSSSIIRRFTQLKESAEKAGATQDAERFQKRLENLGVQF